MSYIPSHAMPHAYVHESEDAATPRTRSAIGEKATALMIGGAALLGYLLFRAVR